MNTSINVSYNLVFADNVSGLSLPNDVLGVLGMGYTTIPNFLDLAYQNKQI